MRQLLKSARLGLVGDFEPAVVAHQAIEESVAIGPSESELQIERIWLPSQSITPGDPMVFDGLHGIWIVPASPYRNTDGVLWAIEFARTKLLPFLGTCGGFQHALLEFVRHVLGMPQAGHAELDPRTQFPLLTRMQCSLVERRETVIVVRDGQFKQAFRADSRLESFHCSFGLNPDYEDLLAKGALTIVARSPRGEVRAIELETHPFFIGTLFQPERQALEGSLHPLVESFFHACIEFSQRDKSASLS